MRRLLCYVWEKAANIAIYKKWLKEPDLYKLPKNSTPVYRHPTNKEFRIQGSIVKSQNHFQDILNPVF
jgi:hypothetical protein